MDIQHSKSKKAPRANTARDAKLFVKLSTLARALDCSRSRIHTAIQAGEIRVVHVLGMARIPIQEFERLVRGGGD